MPLSFLNFLSKRATIWVFSELHFLVISDIKFSFQNRNYFNSFQCKMVYGWHFLHVYKSERVLAKSGRLLRYYGRAFKVTFPSPNDNVQAQSLEVFQKPFSHDVKYDNLNFISEKFLWKKHIFVSRPGNCNCIKKELLHR